MAVHPLYTNVASSLEEYSRFYHSMQDEYARRLRSELDCITDINEFLTPGYCYICGKNSHFRTDFLYTDGQERDGKPIPNWRERMECVSCGLNNRIRACIHFLVENIKAERNSNIYISEQSTPLYRYLSENFQHVTGSEFLGYSIPYGDTDPSSGFRNESMTELSFPDYSRDFILSFDVFEHVPDYHTALAECFRILKPGGVLLFTVPFDKGSHDTLTRARLLDSGEVEHLCEPQYHGDPINDEGCLCYYTFGWDMMEDLRNIGFKTAHAELYWSQEYAYLGHEQLLFVAAK